MDVAEANLVDTLRDPAKKAAVVEDGVALIADEMKRKRGLRGMALKAGYRAVRAVHPGVINKALGKLLPEFAPHVDPFYAEARKSGDVEHYFTRNSGDIAEAMLRVTDARAARARNPVLLRAYKSLRGQAKGHVQDAMPGLARMIKKHVP